MTAAAAGQKLEGATAELAQLKAQNASSAGSASGTSGGHEAQRTGPRLHRARPRTDRMRRGRCIPKNARGHSAPPVL
eukprot:827936-Pyramimonas_sp.AAC.1